MSLIHFRDPDLPIVRGAGDPLRCGVRRVATANFEKHHRPQAWVRACCKASLALPFASNRLASALPSSPDGFTLTAVTVQSDPRASASTVTFSDTLGTLCLPKTWPITL